MQKVFKGYGSEYPYTIHPENKSKVNGVGCRDDRAYDKGNMIFMKRENYNNEFC